MGLDSLTQYLKSRSVVPSVPFEKSAEGTREPAWIGAVPSVPSVPPHFVDTRQNTRVRPFGGAVNDPNPAAQPPADPNAWRELSRAYHAHHVKCSICIAAGRGADYGLRCGVGAALWTSYQNT